MGDWKAVRLNVNSSTKARTELYDLSADTGETNDLAGSHPEIVRKMEEIMEEAHEPSPVFPFDFEVKGR